MQIKFIDKYLKMILKSLTFCCLLFTINCSSLNSIKNVTNNGTIIFIEMPDIKIEISSLSSISSSKSEEIEQRKKIEDVLISYKKWYLNNLSENLIKKGFVVSTEKEKANLIIKPEILDLGEIRGKVIVYSIIFGVLTGVTIAVITGHNELGAGILIFEIVEESLYPLILIKLLKDYYLISTVNYTFQDQNGAFIYEHNFTSFSNEEYMGKISVESRKNRENMVYASLDNNSKKIAFFLFESLKKRE